ncbi:MAG: cysteine-rich CWC family protein [Verrucomicrobia bacterium]|nr:cysteine-rich CWC family protein [Verrucomicrobiota bacterium]
MTSAASRNKPAPAQPGPEVCPLCGQDNHCGVREPDGCWCAAVTMPAGLLAHLPVASRGKACICRSCLAAYQRDPAAFRPFLT